MSDKVNASDFKCRECKKRQATCFWPIIDIDIEASPYCDICVQKKQVELFMRLYDLEQSKTNKKRTEE